MEPKCAEAPQRTHPQRKSHCVGGEAPSERRATLQPGTGRCCSRGAGGWVPRRATLWNMKRGRVCQMDKSEERTATDHGCGKAARVGEQRPVPLLGGGMPRMQPGSRRGRATTTGWHPMWQPVVRPVGGAWTSRLPDYPPNQRVHLSDGLDRELLYEARPTSRGGRSRAACWAGSRVTDGSRLGE